MTNQSPTAESWPQPQAWSWPNVVSTSVLAGSQVTSNIVPLTMQLLGICCLLGTEDTHLQKVGESRGVPGRQAHS